MMEWKDTVLAVELEDVVVPSSQVQSFLKVQAAISFKAGYKEGLSEYAITFSSGRLAGLREVVEFVQPNLPQTLANYVGFWQQWQAKLKEWGIE